MNRSSRLAAIRSLWSVIGLSFTLAGGTVLAQTPIPSAPTVGTVPTRPLPTVVPTVAPSVQPMPGPAGIPAPIVGDVVAPGSVQPPAIIGGKPLPGPAQIWVFANPSGLALGPTSAQLDWKSREGATSYRVWRNGVAIAEVPSKGEASHRIVDSGLAPGSLNTYKVWAMSLASQRAETRDPAGALLEVSNSTVVGTPALAPPTGITASLTSAAANAVRVSWLGASSAVAYRLYRDNQALPGTVAGLSYDDASVASGTHVYAVQSLYSAPQGVQITGLMSSPVKIRVGPFNVVAFGDSVMWGQGLLDAPGQSHKFSSRVRDWLQNSLGKPVTLTSFAHSGATFTPGNSAQEIMATPGEVPNSFPSITRQVLIDAPATLPRAGINLLDVDLVLVDGCSNDIGIATILDPSQPDAEIAAATSGACGGMTSVLTGIRKLFPAARIVLTGYWGIVSPQSDLTAVATLLISAGIVLAPPVAATLGIPLDPVTGLIAGAVTSAVLRNSLVNHSNTFLNASNTALAMATASVNSQQGAGWVTFVQPPFQSDNAYAAPNTWLWLVPTDLFPKDEMFRQRQQICGTVKFQSALEQAKCVQASMGHPNVLGAQAYADAIAAQLATSLGAWRLAHAATQHAP